jgi:hypothetical protein
MRVFVAIAHYFNNDEERPDIRALGMGSGRWPLPRIAALNAEIVALHRHFGPNALSTNPTEASRFASRTANVLDIVVVTARGKNVLDWIGIEPPAITVEYFDGDPLMLGFEAQRLMRERAGAYDIYGYMEDDLIVTDPAFLDKIAWFAGKFGETALLLPTRYEMSASGTLAKVAFAPQLSRTKREFLYRNNPPPVLSADWNGRTQNFRIPMNPHSGCYFLTPAQLARWLRSDSFYDRDTSWIDPLVSAATYAPGKLFNIFTAAEPDPWFLDIEHFGVRYAAQALSATMQLGDSPILKLAQGLAASGEDHNALAKPPAGLSSEEMFAELARLKHEVGRLKGSRSELAKALVRSLVQAVVGRDPTPR